MERPNNIGDIVVFIRISVGDSVALSGIQSIAIHYAIGNSSNLLGHCLEDFLGCFAFSLHFFDEFVLGALALDLDAVFFFDFCLLLLVQLMNLNLSVYIPTNFIFPSKLSKYVDSTRNINRSGREMGIRRLMSINLLKRLESSVESFRLTVERVKKLIDDTISDIDAYISGGGSVIDGRELPVDDADYDDDDRKTDYFTSEHSVKIDLADMDYETWRDRLVEDSETLALIKIMMDDISPEHDLKLQTLLSLIEKKINHPINAGNRKVLVFTAFSDTAEYLYTRVSAFAKSRFGLNTALITGNVDGRTTAKVKRADMNTILTLFSPLSKGKELLMPNNPEVIDVLIATDCISEGQNLQDCDYCINYDIHIGIPYELFNGLVVLTVSAAKMRLSSL